MKAIINGKIVLKDTILENKVLLFEDTILDICDTVPDGAKIIDAKGNIVSPGLVDLHIHGSGGCDAMDGSDDSIDNISKTIVNNGVTSYLPTTMTMSKEEINYSLENIRKAKKSLVGARVLGAHMEGPFINLAYKGAQNSKHIQKPTFDAIKDYTDVLKIITFAPEVDENNEFLKEIKTKTDIVLSIGHSNASFEEAMNAINLGASHITHTFNAMTPLNHRKPGIVGAAFSSDVSAEIIADKIHVNQGIFQMFVNIKGKKKTVLITDSMRAGCMKDGKYDLGGQDVYVKDGSARLVDGTLAGSILTLNKAVLNFYENTNLTLNEAINLASINPATVISCDDRKGSIEIGKDADIAIFNENMDALLTVVEGNIFTNKL